MANTIRVPRAHLILALCLPLAVLIGFFLAQPTDPSGIAMVTLVLALLSTPLVLKFHHPLLVVGWNAAVGFLFLPGAPALWMVLAFVCLGVGVFNRAVNPDKTFLVAPGATRALAFFGGVVVLTAALTGGLGFHSMGSSHYGGRYYLEVAAAIAGYFALTSERIPPQRAGLYVALFFLSGLTALVSNLIYFGGPSLYFLYSLFPAADAVDQARAASSLWPTAVRLGGVSGAATAGFCWLVARYGLRGIFDTTKPWRLVGFALSVVGFFLCGYRSNFVFFGLMLFGVFTLEGLWRSRAVPFLVVVFLAVTAVVLPQTDKLPLVMQRTLSFLPLKIDPAVAEDARYSEEWRIDMWKMLEPQIPKYLIKGKGYNIDAEDLMRAQAANPGGFGSDSAATAVAMEYHNGPLSVLIPFGIAGLLGFLWFIGASLRLLYRHYRFGDPALRQVNTFLLVAFTAKVLCFFVIFGALHAELFWFTGLVGLSVSLNGSEVVTPATEPVPEAAEVMEAA